MSSMSNFSKTITIGSNVLWEKLTGYRARDPGDVPQSAEAMTTSWLTSVLCREIPGAIVTAAEITGGSDGNTTRRAMQVDYNETGRAAGLPTQLFTKCTPFFKSRLQQALLAKPVCEVGFYNEVRPLLDIEATSALHAAYDERSGRTVMIFEDLAKAQNVQFLDANDHVSRPMAESLVRNIAGYHGTMWQHSLLEAFPWLRTVSQFQDVITNMLPYEKCSYVGFERAAEHLPEIITSDHQRIWAAHNRSFELANELPMTLIHGDVHIGNWYKTAAGVMGLTDWNMNKGCWAFDYCYAVVGALSVEDRRAWEKELLALYLEELRARGVANAPSFDEAWEIYRQQMFRALFYWAFTLGAGAMQPDMQLPELSVINLHRYGQAIADLDSVRAVGA